LAVIGDLKQMKPEWLMGTSMYGYGVTLTVGIGIPIPILNEEMAEFTAVRDEEIFAQVVDYGEAYPQGISESLAEVSYAQLKSGKIKVKDREIPTASLSSYPKAVEIAETLKEWIQKEQFLLTEPVASIPGQESGLTIQSLKERPFEQ